MTTFRNGHHSVDTKAIAASGVFCFDTSLKGWNVSERRCYSFRRDCWTAGARSSSLSCSVEVANSKTQIQPYASTGYQLAIKMYLDLCTTYGSKENVEYRPCGGYGVFINMTVPGRYLFSSTWWFFWELYHVTIFSHTTTFTLFYLLNQRTYRREILALRLAYIIIFVCYLVSEKLLRPSMIRGTTAARRLSYCF